VGVIRELIGDVIVHIGKRLQDKPEPVKVPEPFQTDKRYYGPTDGFPEAFPGDNAAWAAEQAELLETSPDRVDPDYYKYIEVTGGL